MTGLLQDFRFALRQLRKSPGFTAAAVLTIALGIGPNTAIFSVIAGVLWPPAQSLFSDREVVLWSRHGKEQGFGDQGYIHVSPREYLEWKRQSKSIEAFGAVVQNDYTLDDESQNPQRIVTQAYTPGMMTMGGPPLIMGRDFLPEEGTPGKEHVVILTHKLWQERFGGDPHILGKQLRLDGVPYGIVGILPQGAFDKQLQVLYTCLVVGPNQPNQDEHFLTVLAFRKQGVSVAQTQSEMETISQNVARAYPKSDAGWSAVVEPADRAWLNPRTMKNLWLLMGTVSLVLLIACVNVSNLLLARGASRQKEIAARLALGATRWQVFRQLLIEGLTLSSIGGLFGIGLSWVLLKIYLALLPPDALRADADIALHSWVLLFTVGTALLAGIIFGCAPAWRAAHLDLNETLKSGSQTVMRRGRHRLGQTLVVVEFALALTLLAGAALTLSNLWRQTHADFGVRTDHILTFQVIPARGRLNTPEQITQYNQLLLEKIHAVPGVQQVAAVNGIPFLTRPFPFTFSIAGRPTPEPTQPLPIVIRLATPEFFQVFGVPLRKGRLFTEQDRTGSLGVVMVNEQFVNAYLAGVEPLMREIVLPPAGPPPSPQLKFQIVGIFRNIDNGEEFGSPTTPELIIPMSQFPQPFASLAVRTSGDPSDMVKSIAAAVHTVDPEMPLARILTMQQIVHDRLGFNRFEAWLYGSFAGLALLLCAVGIYGLMTFVVSQRTPELGMRMALGAERRSIVKMILRDGGKLAGVGLAVGFGAAYYGAKIMQASLYGTRSMSLAAIIIVGIILGGVALLACFIPARRAAKVDPMVALRYE